MFNSSPISLLATNDASLLFLMTLVLPRNIKKHHECRHGSWNVTTDFRSSWLYSTFSNPRRTQFKSNDEKSPRKCGQFWRESVPDQWMPIRTSLRVSLQPNLINPRVAGDTKCIRILYENCRLTESEAIWMPTDGSKLPRYISFVVTCLKDVGHLINTGSFVSQPTLIIHNNFTYIQSSSNRSRWPWGLWHRSEPTWLLGSRVRIPPRSWMFSFVFVVWRVGSSLCDRLITGAEESYRMCVCVCITDLNNEAS